MIAAYAARFSPDDPASGLEIGPRPDPEERAGWSVVDVRAAALNHHDLWTLRGVGLRAEQLPMILGTDAAGVTADGREVVVHGAVLGRAAPGGAGGHHREREVVVDVRVHARQRELDGQDPGVRTALDQGRPGLGDRAVRGQVRRDGQEQPREPHVQLLGERRVRERAVRDAQRDQRGDLAIHVDERPDAVAVRQPGAQPVQVRDDAPDLR